MNDKRITIRIDTETYNKLKNIASATYASGSIGRLIKYILKLYLK